MKTCKVQSYLKSSYLSKTLFFFCFSSYKTLLRSHFYFQVLQYIKTEKKNGFEPKCGAQSLVLLPLWQTSLLTNTCSVAAKVCWCGCCSAAGGDVGQWIREQCQWGKNEHSCHISLTSFSLFIAGE